MYVADVVQPLFVTRDDGQHAVIDMTVYDEIFGRLGGGSGVSVYVAMYEWAIVGLWQYANLAVIFEENVGYLV